MKKIPKSITVTVEQDDYGVLHLNGDRNLSSDTANMRRFGLKIPKGKYEVTYTVDPQGPLRVFVPGIPGLPAIRPVDAPGADHWAHVCFLKGPSWRNKRVSRRVEKVKK